MARKKKRPTFPRMYLAAVDRRELQAFLEGIRQAPQLIQDLQTLLLTRKRQTRTTPAAQAPHTNGEKAGDA